MADVIDAAKGYIDNDGSPLMPRRPAHLDVIEQHAERALGELKILVDGALEEMHERCDACLRSLGRSQEYINRSKGQRARFARERLLKQGA